MTKTYSLLLGAACLWLGGVPHAQADPLTSIELRLHGTPGCEISEDAVRAEAARLLRADARLESMQIDLVVAEADSGYRVQLRAHSKSREAERVLQVEDCAKVRGALPLLVALTVDPDAAAAIDDGAASAPLAPPAPPAPPPPAPPVTPPAAASSGIPPEAAPASAGRDHAVQRAGGDAPSQGVGLGLELRGLADPGVLPGFAFGPSAALEARVGRIALVVAGTWLLSSQTSVSERARARVDADLWSLGLEGRFAAWLGRGWALGPCLLVEGGQYTAASRGVAHPRQDSAAWLAGALGMEGSLRLTEDLGLSAFAELLLPWTRTALSFEDLGEVHRVPVISLRIGLGLRWFVFERAD